MKPLKTNWLGTTALLLALMIGTLACDKKSQNSDDQKEMATTILEIDDLLANIDNLIGDTIELQGVCTHVCEHGGTKMFLMGSDDSKAIKVEADEVVVSFPREVVNSLVKVEGIVVEERIDEAYLAQWEAEEAAQTQQEQEKDGEGACTADQKANNEEVTNSITERIAQFRTRIAERTEKEGKAYVSLYHIEAAKYQIL